jgi:hypothetical protein
MITFSGCIVKKWDGLVSRQGLVTGGLEQL